MSARFDAIVIGAGTNGLTTAGFLAGSGKKVLVVERRDVAGGVAASETFHPGYRAPGILHDTTGLRPSVRHGLDLAGEGLRFEPVPPAVFSPAVPEGGILLHHDPDRALEEIGRVSSHDASAYRGYRAFLTAVREVIAGMADQPPPDLYATSLRAHAPSLRLGLALRRRGTKTMTELLRSAPMCVADWMNERFENELVKSALAAPALTAQFAGPWSPGTVANLLLREALAEGHARGGAWTVAKALESAATKRGVTIRTGAQVEEIVVESGRVRGVRLRGDETLEAEVVAASCDPRRTLLGLVHPRHLDHRLEGRIRSFRGSGTAAKVHLALSGRLEFRGRETEDFVLSRIGGSLDDMERAFDPVKYGELGSAFLLEVFVPTLEAPELAPAGHHVVSVLVHFVPYRLRDGWTPAMREELGNRVILQLSRHVRHLPERIVAREVLTPVDLEERYGLVQGHLHHGDHALDQLFLRPAPECARYRTPVGGLFLCGSGSHPGGGVTCAPGALAAKAILRG